MQHEQQTTSTRYLRRFIPHLLSGTYVALMLIVIHDRQHNSAAIWPTSGIHATTGEHTGHANGIAHQSRFHRIHGFPAAHIRLYVCDGMYTQHHSAHIPSDACNQICDTKLSAHIRSHICNTMCDKKPAAYIWSHACNRMCAQPHAEHISSDPAIRHIYNADRYACPAAILIP